MRVHLLLFSLLLSGAVTATAGEFRLPAGKPVVRLTVSDDWRPESTPRGLMAQSPDGKASLTVALTADAKEMGTLIDESDAMLKARQVKLDRTSRRDNKFKIGDLPSEEIVYTGFGEKGPVVVSFTFVTVGNTAMVFTYRVTGDGNAEHQSELGQIFDSIKTIKASPVP